MIKFAAVLRCKRQRAETHNFKATEEKKERKGESHEGENDSEGWQARRQLQLYRPR
jgi:hypothetical protein